MSPYLIAFLVVDTIVMAFVIRHVIARSRGVSDALAAGASLPSLVQIRRFTDAIHPRIGALLRENWDGTPDALPGVLSMVLEAVDVEARTQGLTLDREVLKKLVEASISKHGAARGGVVREALRQVA